MVKNKRGWIRIIEAFFAVVLILGVVLVAVSKEPSLDESSKKIHSEVNSILQAVELNPILRGDILGIDENAIPMKWDKFEDNGLTDLKNFIEEQTPNYLNCSAKICPINERCTSDQDTEGSVYANSVGVYANKSVYSPKQLRLFCWED